jgi:hypothetical protein
MRAAWTQLGQIGEEGRVCWVVQHGFKLVSSGHTALWGAGGGGKGLVQIVREVLCKNEHQAGVRSEAGEPKRPPGGGSEQGVRNWSEPGELPVEELGGRGVRRSQGDDLEEEKAIKNCHTGVNSRSRCCILGGLASDEDIACNKLRSTQVGNEEK